MSKLSIGSELYEMTQETFSFRYGRKLTEEEIRNMVSKISILATVLMKNEKTKGEAK
jgi:hypothetical protein